MKKIILSIVIIFLITGCSTEYNLEFKDGKFKDSVKIGSFDADESDDFYMLEPVASYKDYDVKYYDFNYKNNYLNLNHEYLYNEYRVSTALIDCFDLSGVTYDDSYYYILTTGEFKCMSYLGYKNEKVKVNFSTDLEVVSANADTIVDNVYTWTFNDDNYKDKEINIKLKKERKIEKEKKNKNNLFNKDIILYFSIVIPISLLLYIAYRKFKKYSDSKNKIPD